MNKQDKKQIIEQEKQKKQKIEQEKHKKLIRNTLENIGFKRISGLESKSFTFLEREGELDDAFYYENILLLMEYTVAEDVWDHLAKKIPLFERINNNSTDFIAFVKTEPRLKSLANIIKEMEEKYSSELIQIRLFYASRNSVQDEHKVLVPFVVFFDYQIVKYFDVISKSIKKSTRYEFFDYIKIPYELVGDNVLKSSQGGKEFFSGEILPPTKSNECRKLAIVTFYIDPLSLLKRSYVLRNDSWIREDNVHLFQRLLIPNKIRDMRSYLAKEQRVFVNNIIVALSPDDITLKLGEKKLQITDDGVVQGMPVRADHIRIEIENKTNIIGIIDGQHRVFAYHEGTDSFEDDISKLRSKQNLLVTGIIIPSNWTPSDRVRFQAKLFLEINSTQHSASSQLHQEIDSYLHPLSPTSISKSIVKHLNESGPLKDCFAIHLADEHKIKTASIISFALNILIRPNNQQGIWNLWDSNKQKDFLSQTDETINDELLNEYIDFCLVIIRNFLIALKNNISKEQWKISSPNTPAILNVTTINGFLNCIRQLVVHNQISDVETYQKHLKRIGEFDFKQYKSSQYNKMGLDLYETFFK